MSHFVSSSIGPENSGIVNGAHAQAFANRIDKTHLAGFRIAPGTVWQAKGMYVISPHTNQIDCCEDHIVQNIIQHAQGVIAPYRDPGVGTPDPSFVLQLSDEVYSGSTLYGVQKFFDGPFQFDVFYESASAKQKLTCTCRPQDLTLSINLGMIYI